MKSFEKFKEIYKVQKLSQKTSWSFCFSFYMYYVLLFFRVISYQVPIGAQRASIYTTRGEAPSYTFEKTRAEFLDFLRMSNYHFSRKFTPSYRGRKTRVFNFNLVFGELYSWKKSVFWEFYFLRLGKKFQILVLWQGHISWKKSVYNFPPTEISFPENVPLKENYNHLFPLGVSAKPYS